MDRPHARHLVAIWFADIVGYSQLAAANEDRALRVLNLFHDRAQATVAEHGGRLVKFVGDAALAEFPSTDAAARSALELVDAVAAVAGIQLRVGLHVGDVAKSLDGDIFGDGVNVAARLQSEAAPAQVLVSEDAWHQLRQREGYRFRALGRRLLKGQAEPRAIYIVSVAGQQDEHAAAVPISPSHSASTTGIPRSFRRWGTGRDGRGIIAAVIFAGLFGGWLNRGTLGSWFIAAPSPFFAGAATPADGPSDAAALSDETSAAPAAYRLRVVVLGPDGSPVVPDSIWSSWGGERQSLVTGGTFVIPTASLPQSGTVTVHAARAATCERGSATRSLAGDPHPEVLVRLERDTSAVVTGTVRDEASRAVAGARVFVEGYGDQEVVTTNEVGAFRLRAHATPCEQVRVNAERAGYEPSAEYVYPDGVPASLTLARRSD